MRHQSLLAYANYRYFKVAVVVVALAIGVYVWDNPPGGPGGGTWLGYALGTIGALLILWLLWFGVRKRRYSAAGAPLLGWLSAHVYLGVSLIVIATLHTGFQVGLNVHTLAYLLMLFVILSGFYGVYVYLARPAGDDRQPRRGNAELAAAQDRRSRQAGAPAGARPAGQHQPGGAVGGAGNADRRFVAPAAFRDRPRLRDRRRGRQAAARSARRCAARKRGPTSSCTRCCCASRSCSRAPGVTSRSRRGSTCGSISTCRCRSRCWRR